MNAMISEARSENGRPEPIFGSMLIALGLIIRMRFNRAPLSSPDDQRAGYQAERR